MLIDPPLESVNVGARIVSVSLVDAVMLPEVPVMVSVVVPTAAELEAVSVS
jgi:hypothetical protein